MEPPEDNKVEVDRIKDQEQKNIMMKGLKKFKDEFIEKIMKKYYAKEQREPEDLDIFDPWFQMEGDSDGSEDIDYTSGIRFLESKSKKQKSVFNEEEKENTTVDPDSEGEEGGKSIEGEGRGGKGTSDGPGHGDGKEEREIKVKLKKLEKILK